MTTTKHPKTLGPKQAAEARKRVNLMGSWQTALAARLGDDQFATYDPMAILPDDIRKAQDLIRYMRYELDAVEELLARPARKLPAPDQVPFTVPDSRGNHVRVEGCDRCACGCKYWENDTCVDCGSTVGAP